jgi:predicted CXXCH cytochrome family protein
MSRLRILLAGLALVPALAARAIDAPHDNWDPNIAASCSGCHLAHRAADAGLTKTAGNANLCKSCHDLVPNSSLGFPWADTVQAVPGTGGHSHSWSALATSLGATPPAPGTPMGIRLDNGRLTCSTCHDQHNNNGRSAGSTQHASYPIGVAQAPVGGATGRTMTLASVAAGAAPKGYLVQFVTAGALTAARFKLSNDGGRTWFGCSAPTTYNWVAATAPPDATNNPCQPAGTNISLNDGTNVQVTFAATTTFAVGDQFKFYVGYPFVRVSNADSAMCVTCHQDRDMHWQDVEGGNANGIAGGAKTVVLGQTVFHHPVGQALNANGGGYDRATPLDANGATGSADGNATNDLKLGTGGAVHCLSCHSMHNSDSNAATVDK